MQKRPRHGIYRAADGATAVEFALISPVVVLLVMGIIEMSLMMLAQNLMESATFAASRTGKTGYVAGGTTREDTILQALNNIAGSVLDTNRIIITSASYDEFGDIGEPEPFVDANANGVRDEGENYTDVNGNSQYDSDMGASGAGDSGEVVVYTVTYPWHIATPIVNSVLGDENGDINLVARTVVRNEPF
jgi:Flp pilus assembly protein TadG